MQITADSFNKSIVHLFLILCSKLRISKFADLNFVLNVLMFVPYPQSIKSLHSNRALQGPGDQNRRPKWTKMRNTIWHCNSCWIFFFTGKIVPTKKFKSVEKCVATSSFLQLLNCSSPHKKDTKCHKKSRNTKKAGKNRGHWLIPAAAVSLTSKVEVLQKLTKHIEAKGRGAKTHPCDQNSIVSGVQYGPSWLSSWSWL